MLLIIGLYIYCLSCSCFCISICCYLVLLRIITAQQLEPRQSVRYSSDFRFSPLFVCLSNSSPAWNSTPRFLRMSIRFQSVIFSRTTDARNFRYEKLHWSCSITHLSYISPVGRMLNSTNNIIISSFEIHVFDDVSNCHCATRIVVLRRNFDDGCENTTRILNSLAHFSTWRISSTEKID